jgi:hypothetical protein
MINQQLLDFIKQKLSSGITRDQITQLLKTNGWNDADINEAFTQITNPGATNQVPMPTPALSVSPIPSSSSTPPITQNIKNSKHSLKNPSWTMALVTALVASIISSLFILINPQTKNAATSEILSYGTIVIFVSLLIGGVVLNFITRILKISGSSVPKALTFSAIQTLIAFILALLMILIPSIIVPIIGLFIFFLFFCLYYQVTFLKSLAVFALGLLFSIILSIILTLIAYAVGFSIFKFLMPSNNIMPVNTGLPQTNVNTTNPIQVNNITSNSSNTPQTNNGTTNQSDAMKAEQGFPAGFPFPDNSQITKATVSTDFSGTQKYSLEYTIQANVTETKTTYENFFKENGFETSAMTNQTNQSIFITAEKSDTTTNPISIYSLDFTLKPTQNGETDIIANSRYYK